jgi:hypothetical protein
VPSKYTWKFLKVLFSVFLKILILGKETMNSTNMKVFVSVSVVLELALGLS